MRNHSDIGYLYEAKVRAPAGVNIIATCYEAINWLSDQEYYADTDWTIDMHGGMENYTTFWFKDENLRLMFQMRWI